MSWKGIMDFLGISSPPSKSTPIKLPHCFGVYRSPQADAENRCADCIRNTICFKVFNEKQAAINFKSQISPAKQIIYGDLPRTEIGNPCADCAKNTICYESVNEEQEVTESKAHIPPTKQIEQRVNEAATNDAEKEFLKIFKQLTYRHRTLDVWRDFVLMFACALSNPVDKSNWDEREALYMKTISKYNKQEQALFPELVAQTILALELNPEQDFLGKIFMTFNLGNSAKGQVFTPYHICRLMASVVTNDVAALVEKQGYVTFHDPCCGAGATMIAGIHEARRQLEEVGLNWQNHVFVGAQDIDQTVALMCYIQLSLLGAAAYIKVGNSLTDPTTSEDTNENYWFTAMYFSDVWATRRLVSKMSSLIDEKETN